MWGYNTDDLENRNNQNDALAYFLDDDEGFTDEKDFDDEFDEDFDEDDEDFDEDEEDEDDDEDWDDFYED